MIITGDEGVGKRTLVQKFCDEFNAKSKKRFCPICMQEFENADIYSHIKACIQRMGPLEYSKSNYAEKICPICFQSFKIYGKNDIESHVTMCALNKIRKMNSVELNENTIGVKFFIKYLPIEGMGTARLQIWEFRNDERFRFLLPTYVKGANGIIFLFSLTDMQTLIQLDEWLPILRNYDPNIPIMIVGTNLDLKEQRMVQKEEAIEIARTRDCSAYVEISAKENINVEDIFATMGKIMMDYQISK